MAQRRARAPWYVPSRALIPLTASFTCDTSEILYGENSVTFTVTLSDGTPYSGPVYFTYSSGLSGVASATCTDGSVTISVTNSSLSEQTITIAVEASEQVEAGSQSYTLELGYTVWEFDTVEGCTTAGVPVSIDTAYTGMLIAWGDGSITTVSSVSDYVHTYSTAGQYHISVYYDAWESVTLSYSSGTSEVSPLVEARTSIAKVYAIPKVANTSFEDLFYRYTSLVEVADNLFAYNTQVTIFNYAFEQTALSAIPATLFRYNTLAESFIASFSSIKTITEIPENLFSNNTLATDFTYCFYGCDGLTAIPANLFSTNTAATTFNHCFGDDTGLATLPSDLFANNAAVTDFSYCFQGCTGLTELPEGLFRSNTAVTNFAGTFYDCTGLTALPSDLFANNAAVTDFSYCFQGCTGLTAIPDGLFDNNTEVETFAYMFYACVSLTDIPSDLFVNNTKVVAFMALFYSVPIAANMQCEDGTQHFSLDIGSAVVTSFSDGDNVFWTPAQASVDAVYINVPEGSTTETTASTYNENHPGYALTLNTDPCYSGNTWSFDTVDDCTTAGVPISTDTAYTGMTINWGDGTTTTVASVSDYVHTYETAGKYHITVTYDAWETVELSVSSSTTSVPSPIAEARASIAKVYAIPHVANTSFRYLFHSYSVLAEVASDTFANNPQILSFNYMFYGCSSLVSIPSGLFDNNTVVETCNGVFINCSNLVSIPSGLFDNNTNVTDFANAFNRCYSLASIPTNLFRYNTLVQIFSNAFRECNSLTGQAVYVGSTDVMLADYFMYNTGSGNTVYVPSSSATYSVFSSASYVGATIATYTA